MALALVLLGMFITWNYYAGLPGAKDNEVQEGETPREQMPDTLSKTSKRLAFHDFEWGNATDTASHLAIPGHTGKQSFRMRAKVPYSPGLWIKFNDLKPGAHSWIRATGYVWFSCPPAEAKCSLVATCNRKGINYKYMAIPVENENVKSNQWNRITIDYRIPEPVGGEDVLQAYFWYRGEGEMLVDDIEIEIFTSIPNKLNH